MKNIFLNGLLCLIILSDLSVTKAWVYPEHRDIMLIAIEKLSTDYRTSLDELWARARVGYLYRLSEAVIEPEQLLKPELIDYAAWPAIAGDHSCSSENMLHNILETNWILKVADITAQLKIDLAFSKDRTDRINSLRTSDLRLQNVDPEYATRAGSNNAHFLTSLPDVNMDVLAYILFCIKDGADLNALGVYAFYHYSALSKATRLSNENLTSEERSALTLSALADEAFAIHFLEDMFAAGHAAGTWGDASQRKGTHDYYNEMGLKTSIWNGENIVLTGDAWMRNGDAEIAAYAVRLSIQQLIDATNGKYPAIISDKKESSLTTENFNICQNNYMPALQLNPDFESLLMQVLIKTPVPALVNGLGDLPRFRAEVGMFVGFSPAMRGWLISGGFSTEQKTIGTSGGLEIAGRIGVGLDGVLNETGDGLAFLDVGFRQDGSSSIGLVPDPAFNAYGSLYAAIPGRSAFSARLRLPFYALPGDLLILGPVLFFIDQEALTSVGVAAVNGGLIPWQAGIETSFGRFQFVLGREVAVYLYGRTKERDALVTYSVNDLYIISYRSTQIEFPIVEYRPFRSFDADQRSSLFIQLFGGVDFPHDVEVLETALGTETTPELKTVWSLGLRLVFDWRHYF
jgi:hypothetical protein